MADIEEPVVTNDPTEKKLQHWLNVLKLCRSILLTLGGLLVGSIAMWQSCQGAIRANAGYEALAKEVNKLKDQVEETKKVEEIHYNIQPRDMPFKEAATKLPETLDNLIMQQAMVPTTPADG
jgi:hypothetical protein